jgi:hypothetical protein
MEVVTDKFNLELYFSQKNILNESLKASSDHQAAAHLPEIFAQLKSDVKIEEDYSYIIPVVKGISKKTSVCRNCRINLFYLTCSCKVYRERVKKYKRRDLRRICKHIYYTISSETAEYYNELTKILIETHFWFALQKITRLTAGDEEIYIGFTENSHNVNIIAKEENWKRYIYDVKDSKWDEYPPKNRLLIENYLKTFNFTDNKTN